MGRVQGLPCAQSARSQGQCHAVDDVGQDGIEVIREIRTIYDNDKSTSTESLASSMRTPLHVKLAAIAGADVATIPPAVLRNLARHPLTEKELEAFLADWKEGGASDPATVADRLRVSWWVGDGACHGVDPVSVRKDLNAAVQQR
jgi:hypothetical protein